MGNDNAYKSKGISNIRMKIFNGTITILIDIRYVPNLKNNLISLGTLDSNGSKVTVKKGILKVIRGALVAMKGTRKRNLYFLDGNIVIERVVVSNSLDRSNTYRLWYMRLEHNSEKTFFQLWYSKVF